jgi:hypothetical protein
VRLAEGPTVLGGTAPFCRMSDCPGARGAYATGVPLVELSLVRSHMCRRGRGYVVHRGSLRGGLFPCPPGGLARRPSPGRTGTFRFSLPSCRLSFRVPSEQGRRAVLSHTALPAWVPALLLTSLRCAHLPSLHGSAGADPGVLNRSTASASKLASVFHPAARFRTVSRSGACPLCAAFSPHQAGCAHAV